MFAKREVKPAKNKTVTVSQLSRQLEESRGKPNNPFLEYSKFEGEVRRNFNINRVVWINHKQLLSVKALTCMPSLSDYPGQSPRLSYRSVNLPNNYLPGRFIDLLDKQGDCPGSLRLL